MKQQDARNMTSTSKRGSIISWALAFASLALGLAFSTTLGGCSGDSSDDEGSGGTGGSAATGLPNPCTLATPAELGAIVDVTIVRSEQIRGLTGDPGCTWYDASSNAVFQLSLWNGRVQYDYSKDDDDSMPLSGIGAEAYLGVGYTVHVLTDTGDAFFAQSLYPVKDGNVSPEIQAAVSSDMTSMRLEYEAALRLAKLVINDL
jgi:hypothetical protein